MKTMNGIILIDPFYIDPLIHYFIDQRYEMGELSLWIHIWKNQFPFILSTLLGNMINIITTAIDVAVVLSDD